MVVLLFYIGDRALMTLFYWLVWHSRCEAALAYRPSIQTQGDALICAGCRAFDRAQAGVRRATMRTILWVVFAAFVMTALFTAGARTSALAANACVACQNRCAAKHPDLGPAYGNCKLACKGSRACLGAASGKTGGRTVTIYGGCPANLDKVCTKTASGKLVACHCAS